MSFWTSIVIHVAAVALNMTGTPRSQKPSSQLSTLTRFVLGVHSQHHLLYQRPPKRHATATA
tara:strand:- start:28 stop:213 length:186 start_codon:yes stop_codon:yes gene_type:complete